MALKESLRIRLHVFDHDSGAQRVHHMRAVGVGRVAIGNASLEADNASQVEAGTAVLTFISHGCYWLCLYCLARSQRGWPVTAVVGSRRATEGTVPPSHGQ